MNYTYTVPMIQKILDGSNSYSIEQELYEIEDDVFCVDSRVRQAKGLSMRRASIDPDALEMIQEYQRNN